jgi:hypothetical protein
MAALRFRPQNHVVAEADRRQSTSVRPAACGVVPDSDGVELTRYGLVLRENQIDELVRVDWGPSRASAKKLAPVEVVKTIFTEDAVDVPPPGVRELRRTLLNACF